MSLRKLCSENSLEYSIIDRIERIFKLLEYISLYIENNIHEKLNVQFSIKIVYF